MKNNIYEVYFNPYELGYVDPEFEGTKPECKKYVNDEVNYMAASDFKMGLFSTLKKAIKFSERFYEIKPKETKKTKEK